MAEITLNSAVRSNLRNLQSATDLISQTSERLSTGKKVNSALDNPNSFFTSQALDRRASDFSTLLDSVSNSVKTLEAADNGIKAITDVVEGLKATARSALQSPTAVETKSFIESADLGDATAANLLGGTVLAAADTLVVKDKDDADVTITFGTAAGEVDTLDELNKKFEDSEVNLTASFSDGKLKIETTNNAANTTATAATGTATGVGAAFTTATFSAPVLDADAAEKRANYVSDFNEALEQITSLAKDSSFNGVNLLNADDLEITFNEDGTSKLDVKGTTFDAGGLGLGEIASADFYDSDAINAVIDKIDSAFSTLEAQSSKFGSQLQIVQTRETFTKDMIGTLEDGALALVGADTNAEAANLATLQTRQSLIVSSLSISTSQESNVLQLLR